MENYQQAPAGIKKTRGFADQKMIVLPDSLIRKIYRNPLSEPLYITHIGYFPNARHHFRERPDGTPQFILIWCTNGNGWYQTDGKANPVKQDQMILLPAGIPHRYGADKNKPWSIYWVHFAGTYADRFVKTVYSRYPDFKIDVSFIPDRVAVFDEMYKALELGFSNENLGYANSVMWHFLATLCYHKTYQLLKSEQINDPVEETILYMKEKTGQTLTLAELADKARFSPSYFSSRFKEKTGYSPIDYFIQLKIQKACRYLDLTSMQVKEISIKVGYDDVHYFSRIFKKIMGCSPSEYRKNVKG